MTTGTNNLTDVAEDTKNWKENLQYLILLLIILGQSISAVSVLGGQMSYLVANGVGIYHVFALKRPRADKVKNVACLGVTLTILVVKFL
jgi:hypothetical protein